LVSEAITQALALDSWARLDEETRYQRLELCHYGIAQRWLVVYSQAALERAEATLNQASQREDEAIHKPLFHLQAQRFTTPEAAQEALTALAKGWTYHLVDSYSLSDHKRYARKGRPTPSTPVTAIEWQIQAHVRPHETAIGHQKQYHACVVIGTNIGASALGDTEVIAAYKRQSRVEGGFRFLKDPLFLVSSLFVKKPCRIQGLLMVMTLALLVYSVAQRRLRQPLAHHHETVPNQINQPPTSPTLRWVFQLLEGIHRVRGTVQGQVHDLIEGLNDVQVNVLRLFGEEVCRLYQISPG
jgi:transposase